MIIVDNISKSYGAQELFRETGFRLNSRERLGLVGRNGHGKTTLLRLITGEEEPDSGSIVIPKGYLVGCVAQEPDFSEDTVLKEGCTGLADEEKGNHWKVEKILAGLGFSIPDMEKHPSELSGGFQIRLNLAKVLAREYNLLLLDEPNNYLDITSIRWLTQFLNGWKGELILITHDRGFMDHVVTHTMGIYRKTFRKIKGDTGKLYDQLALEEEVYEKTRLNDEKKRKKSEEFIRRFRAKARLGSLVQSRIKALEKQERLEKLEQAKDLDFSFISKPFNGKPLMNVLDLSYGYGDGPPLFSDLSFSLGPYDRMCVIGKNGKGKTTLLKTLAGAIRPRSGEVSFNITSSSAYYEQSNISNLDDDRTVLDEILLSNPDMDQQKARNICGMMMFEGDSALKKIKVLSGGEKNRVMLGKVIATPVNLLLLDEPTNHLDMESCDALLEAINEFDGAVLMVTHNEMLLHGLAERLVVFQEGGAKVYEGGYQRFLETRGWDDEKAARAYEPPEGKLEKKVMRKDMKRLRAEMVRERGRELRPLETMVRDLERMIVEAEGRLEKLHQEIVVASQKGESAAIADLSKEIHSREREIESLFRQLEPACARLEEKKRHFAALMKEAGFEE
ncbi:MAG: ATP-binding cassette domain-containing protein [Candidatus Krumholzibacteria bacterium]|nr:ATP-binding cassette domain-containing protein [Candidatus Krumholzibacteria bacterium]